MTYYCIKSEESTSEKLKLYIKKNVIDEKKGKIGDKLGDAFEEYCENLFSSIELLNCYNGTSCLTEEYNMFDFYIFQILLNLTSVFPNQINNINATREIPTLSTGGNPKTDLLITVNEGDDEKKVPVSIKQTTSDKVSIAEFSVDTIINEVGIENPDVISLMKKHQTDSSAKKFSDQEKSTLKTELNVYRENLVRWALTGSKEKTGDIRNPDYLIRFNLYKYTKDTISDICVKSVEIFSMDDYVNKTLQSKAGFGTGLQWTYATGSKGNKIQFKA